MEWADLIRQAKDVKTRYRTLPQKPWGAVEFTQGLVGDVGDLTKLIMAKQGFRAMDNVDQKLTHELLDCLWAVLMIADELGIDLEKEFPRHMDMLKKR